MIDDLAQASARGAGLGQRVGQDIGHFPTQFALAQTDVGSDDGPQLVALPVACGL